MEFADCNNIWKMEMCGKVKIWNPFIFKKKPIKEWNLNSFASCYTRKNPVLLLSDFKNQEGFLGEDTNDFPISYLLSLYAFKIILY